MHRFIFTVSLSILLALLLAACGGSEEEGVNLQVAGETVPTPTVTPEPDVQESATTDELRDLPGRLLYRTGRAIEILDLATGEVTTMTANPSATVSEVDIGSTVLINESQTRGAFVDLPNFGIVDFATNTLYPIPNNGSFPAALRLSPDGQWFAIQTGTGFVTRVQLFHVDTGERFNIAASSQHQYLWAFTPQSDFLWTEVGEDSAVMRFDPALGESVPIEPDTVYEVLTYAPQQVAPDGTQFARIPRGPGLANTQDNPEACFDSYVELVPLPVMMDNPFPQGDTVYSEARLVASDPQWLDNDHMIFLKYGEGECGDVQGDQLRQIMIIDLTTNTVSPIPNAGPLGNADDVSDFAQFQARTVGHLFSPSPDGRYVAWVSGNTRADETLINVTEIATGITEPVVRFSRAEAGDASTFIERTLLRQVVWLE